MAQMQELEVLKNVIFILLKKKRNCLKKNDSETEKMLFYRAQQLVVDVYCKGAK